MRSRIVAGFAFVLGILITAVMLLGKEPVQWKPLLGGLLFIGLGGYYLFTGREQASVKEFVLEGKLAPGQGEPVAPSEEVAPKSLEAAPQNVAPPTALTIAGVLWRFLGAYIGLAVVILIGFAMAGATPNTGVNTASLIGAVIWPCLAFGNKNGRYFTAAENSRVVRDMVGIDFLIQVLAGLAVSVAGKPVSLGALLIAALFVTALHAIVIYVTVGQAGKIFAKQQAKRLVNAAG